MLGGPQAETRVREVGEELRQRVGRIVAVAGSDVGALVGRERGLGVDRERDPAGLQRRGGDDAAQGGATERQVGAGRWRFGMERGQARKVCPLP